MIDPIALTRDLVRIDTRNPPGNEAVCAAYLADVLGSYGFVVELSTFGEGRVNLVVSTPGGGGPSTRPPVIFTGHIDTVPFGQSDWTEDPLGGEVRDGRLYGRGSTDMKAGVAAMVSAFVAEAERLRGHGGAMLVVTGGEETGCDGARALVRHGLPERAVLLVVGEPTSNRLLCGHKGALWLGCACQGRTAHGAFPQLGDNAIYKAAQAVGKLERFQFNVERHPVMDMPTLNVGTFSGGLNTNSVPDRAEFTVDIRTTPSIANETVADQISFELGGDVDMKRLVDLPAVWTDPLEAAIGRVSSIASEITGVQSATAAAHYFTDAAVFAPALHNCPTIILGPGEPDQAHKTNEYCLVEKITEAERIYRAILVDFCRP